MADNQIKRVGCEMLSTGMPAKIPHEVPPIWKQQAVDHIQTNRWLEAVVYGLTHHVWESGDEEALRLKSEITKNLDRIIRTIKRAKWGGGEKLQGKSGRIAPHPSKVGWRIIEVGKSMLGPKGNLEKIDGSYIPLRCLVLLHEGLHRFFDFPGVVDRKVVSEEEDSNDEDWLAERMEFYYFSECSPLNTVLKIPNDSKGYSNLLKSILFMIIVLTKRKQLL